MQTGRRFRPERRVDLNDVGRRIYFGDLNALLSEARLFQTGSIPMPASRFLCEHLHQKVFFWARISRIHAQVPVREMRPAT